MSPSPPEAEFCNLATGAPSLRLLPPLTATGGSEAADPPLLSLLSLNWDANLCKHAPSPLPSFLPFQLSNAPSHPPSVPTRQKGGGKG